MNAQPICPLTPRTRPCVDGEVDVDKRVRVVPRGYFLHPDDREYDGAMYTAEQLERSPVHITIAYDAQDIYCLLDDAGHDPAKRQCAKTILEAAVKYNGWSVEETLHHLSYYKPMSVPIYLLSHVPKHGTELEKWRYLMSLDWSKCEAEYVARCRLIDTSPQGPRAYDFKNPPPKRKDIEAEEAAIAQRTAEREAEFAAEAERHHQLRYEAFLASRSTETQVSAAPVPPQPIERL